MLKESFKNRLAALKSQSKVRPAIKTTSNIHIVAKKAAPKSALDYACLNAKRGIPAIWIPRGTKKPVMTGWPTKATTDATIIRQWEKAHPGCNFGLAMGGSFIAIDIDDTSVIPHLKAQGLELTPTLTHDTPGGGRHFIYEKPADVVIKNSVKILPGVDIRAEGGQIVGPGSTHPNGGRYELYVDLPIAKLPQASLKLLTGGKPNLPAAPVAGTARGKVAEGQRNTTLTSIAGTLHAHGMPLPDLKEQLLLKNATYDPPLDEEEVLGIAESVDKYPVPDSVAALLDVSRPKIMLAGDNRELATFATELGEVLADKPVFVRAREVVVLDSDDTLTAVSAQTLRTLVSKYLVCIKRKMNKENHAVYEVKTTMVVGDSLGVLASPQFKDQLRPLERIAFCRLPVMRADGHIEMLPEGYDAATQTMTLSDVDCVDDMAFSEGLTVIEDLLSEFNFADKTGRSKAVAVAGLLGLYAAQIMPVGTKRPVFITTKNAEGAGGSLITAFMVVPVIGNFPATTMPAKEEEMGKTLLTYHLKASPVIVFDNVKDRIGGAFLEGFTDNVRWGLRVLGGNEDYEGPNNTVVFINANGATVTPDMRRRSLFIELHLKEERAEDHVYTHTLNIAALIPMRPKILAACWSLVRNWDAMDRPLPTRSHSQFPEWARIIGGMVEAAGFACPLDTSNISIVADEDGDAMRTLVKAWAAQAKQSKPHTFQEIIDLCRAEGIFTGLVGGSEFEMKTGQRSAMGYVLKRYDDRLIGDHKFTITDSGHHRRYSIERVKPAQHGRTVEHGPTALVTKQPFSSLGVQTHARPCDRAPGVIGKLKKFAKPRGDK
jgi:hypothetical protein